MNEDYKLASSKRIDIKILLGLLFSILAVLLIIIAWVYRDDLFQSIYDPDKPFQTTNPPPAPDYKKAENWLYRPDLSKDPIHYQGGDVFVISPTVFLGRSGWNAELENEKYRQQMQTIILPNYVLPFRLAGRVFAPHYRQAGLYTFLTNRDDAALAQKLAYEDIRRAFLQFKQDNPPERPIVLVGFGQGGLHLERLLKEFFSGDENKDLRQKLAIAYVIDHPLPLVMIKTQMPPLKPCANKNDTHCIVAFGAFTPKEEKRARMFVQKTMVWDDKNWLEAVAGRKLLCVNPLLWSIGTDYAPARLHKGGVAAEGLTEDIEPAAMSGQTGAQCQDGLLLLDRPKQKSLRRPNRFGGKFRTPPSNLFYEDLRQDARRRVDALLSQNILPKRAPLLEMETIEVDKSPVTLPLKKYKKQKKN